MQLTIRLEEDREKRDNWIECLNRAAQLGIHDLYEYEDSGEVGRGRYSGVYQAKRKGEDGQEVALKIIDKKMFWSRVVKGRERGDTLIRETSVQATMTAKCSNIPAFVRLCGFFETSDNVVLELELLKGMDLFQYVSSKGVLSEKEAALILRDILSVLDGMNRAGLAHRDIKPANCLMCKTENTSLNNTDASSCVVKVADFGMATFAGVDGLLRGRCGTPGYVAPEIYRAGLHGGYGNKVDVFSAGVILYVLLCGYEPFYGESDADLVAANKEAKVEFPSSDWKQGMLQHVLREKLLVWVALTVCVRVHVSHGSFSLIFPCSLPRSEGACQTHDGPKPYATFERERSSGAQLDGGSCWKHKKYQSHWANWARRLECFAAHTRRSVCHQLIALSRGPHLCTS